MLVVRSRSMGYEQLIESTPIFNQLIISKSPKK
jgi:hypothetical protein